MILQGKIKGLAQNGPKLLSAHLFFWPKAIFGWATHSAQSPIEYSKTAGPSHFLGNFSQNEGE